MRLRRDQSREELLGYGEFDEAILDVEGISRHERLSLRLNFEHGKQGYNVLLEHGRRRRWWSCSIGRSDLLGERSVLKDSVPCKGSVGEQLSNSGQVWHGRVRGLPKTARTTTARATAHTPRSGLVSPDLLVQR